MRCRGFPFRFASIDPARLDKSAQFLAEFGERRTITTADGVTLNYVHYSSERFEQWIREHGGSRQGNRIVPNTPEDWELLKRLAEFKFKQVGNAFEVPELVSGANQKCILRCNGFGLPIETDKKSIGLHLAAGFNYSVFEWRQEASIAGFFQDAEAAYQAARSQGFSPRQIKALGYCGPTYVVAHLKEQHHREGLDAVMIGAHTSLSDVVAHAPWPANKIGRLGLGALEKDGVNFDNIQKFEHLSQTASRVGCISVCFIMNPHNEIVSDDTVDRLTHALEPIGGCELILKPDSCSDEAFNFNRQFAIPEVWGRYTAFLSR